jgi:peptide-methionine (S)-S-oxide reductase
MATAIFSAGCFWGVQFAFDQIKGVTTRVGYTGGTVKNPSYELVCTGKTGHAEAVEVVYNPKEVSYQQLLDEFWKCHDPTQRNRQGPDVGNQYRSAIFFATEEQQKLALASKTIHEKKLGKPIATEITKASVFYPAEEYHQKYFEKTGRRVCHF